MSVISLMGEYDCKLDAKGRVMMPSALKKQIPAESQNTFVINRGFEKCLVIYPKAEWDLISQELNKLNLFSKNNRDFFRYFMRGASMLELDANNRFLIPKNLLEYAGATKEIVLFAYSNRIEVWDKSSYENLLSDEPRDFASLAEEVMVQKANGEKETNIS
ncbi:MAG: division/cell wall cluster transcriptional repressor MraZ [Bacteroidales bacterium]|jgi:MraZ protein